jgi:hypothetical protein
LIVSNDKLGRYYCTIVNGARGDLDLMWHVSCYSTVGHVELVDTSDDTVYKKKNFKSFKDSAYFNE